MGLYWWLHGKLTRRSRAARWAEGIYVRVDDAGVEWQVPPGAEFADSGKARWDELAGVAEEKDNGAAPDDLFVFRRGATTADFLPLEAEGARTLLDAARRRGLERPFRDLVAEREANDAQRRREDPRSSVTRITPAE